ncbi:unnamed protein product [Meganyctiphanes norvegica]|uniref:Envelope protein n=1 Tax=Meganyctiphanes norvegica TaxID=48144 RepID=A0AAV2RN88_MEGNR
MSQPNTQNLEYKEISFEKIYFEVNETNLIIANDIPPKIMVNIYTGKYFLPEYCMETEYMYLCNPNYLYNSKCIRELLNEENWISVCEYYLSENPPNSFKALTENQFLAFTNIQTELNCHCRVETWPDNSHKTLLDNQTFNLDKTNLIEISPWCSCNFNDIEIHRRLKLSSKEYIIWQPNEIISNLSLDLMTVNTRIDMSILEILETLQNSYYNLEKSNVSYRNWNQDSKLYHKIHWSIQGGLTCFIMIILISIILLLCRKRH